MKRYTGIRFVILFASTIVLALFVAALLTDSPVMTMRHCIANSIIAQAVWLFLIGLALVCVDRCIKSSSKK